MRFFRLSYLFITLGLFLSLIALGVVVILRPDLAGEYGVRVVVAIVAGAVLLLGLDVAARKFSRNCTTEKRRKR